MVELNTVPVYRPFLDDRENQAVLKVLSDGWISSKGSQIAEFESATSGFTGFKCANTVANGTLAINLAMSSIGLNSKSRIVCPSMTYVASITPAIHLGAEIELVDVDPETWLAKFDEVESKNNFDLQVLEPVDLFGSPFDIAGLSRFKELGFLVLSDSAESFGSIIHGKHAGKGADATTFSFFGNKTITTGEGGMVCTDNQDIDEIGRRLKNQGLSLSREYFHDIPGHNFRMTNIQATIGLVQISKLHEILVLKHQIYDTYDQYLDQDRIVRQKLNPGAESNYWMCSFLAPNEGSKKRIRKNLADSGIETRPFFTPLHELPFVKKQSTSFPVSEELWRRGFSLPSWPGISAETLVRISNLVNDSL
jgi:perosamine synthetase